MRHLKTVLNATDFSRNSEEALELACSLARDHGARLIVLHVVPPATPVTGGPDVSALRRGETCQEDLRGYRAEMERRLRDLPLPGFPRPVERLLRDGDAAATIVRTAEEVGCDLVVLGTHGRSGKARDLMGSVAAEVARRAPCPVVTVKACAAEKVAAPAEAGLSR